MIKRIPIKGISRDPSGQIAADGFCVDSVNVQLDMGEVAPMIRPRRITDSLGSPVEVNGDILYIHKGSNYENLLFRYDNGIWFTAIIDGGERSGPLVTGLGSDEAVNDVTSIGNTVVISTTKEMYYILWREGAYHYLGNKIPIPDIAFRVDALRAAPRIQDISPTTDPSGVEGGNVFTREGSEAPFFPHSAVGDSAEYGTVATKYVFNATKYSGFWNEYLDSVWGDIDGMLQEKASSGKAVYPVFIRYAVRLYDGTLYAQSIPILLGAEISKFIDIKGLIIQANSGSNPVHTIIFTFLAGATAYSPLMTVSNRRAFEGWEDIVTGVDLFISPQLLPLQRNAAKLKVTNFGSQSQHEYCIIENFVLDPYYAVEHQEELVRNYQTTYLAKSYTIDEFKELSGEIALEDINFSSDEIMSHEALVETSQSMHYSMGERLFNYNNSLILAGAKQKLYAGYPHIHSSKWASLTPQQWILPATPYRFVFYIRGDNGESIAITDAVPQKKVFNNGNNGCLEVPVAWIAYPDSRCYKVEIYHLLNEATIASYPMKTLDQIDVAYAFLGFGVTPLVKLTEHVPENNGGGFYEMPNTLLVSETNNPFVFPAGDSVSFTGKEVLNMAVATIPLSEGQFGLFPLYVFTDEGVFALSVNAEGRFVSNHPVSRDVLINRDALAGIEQGVFFASARGLLLLRGSTVTKVSSLMDGRPSALKGDLGEAIGGYVGQSVDTPEAFNEFIKSCAIAYDYANSRILLVRDGYSYQYVYKFDTESWHRIKAGVGTAVRVINTYPEATIVTRVPMITENQAAYDFSVFSESSNAVSLPGFFYTRDLILDNADIYKTVNRLKVRGRFVNGHVKWQLQGSNDGINYRDLHSLRGPSWKWYRIMVVSMLDPGERISYIEIDYDPRFTNKIR